MKLTLYIIKHTGADGQELFWRDNPEPCFYGELLPNDPTLYSSRIEAEISFEDCADVYGYEGLTIENSDIEFL